MGLEVDRMESNLLHLEERVELEGWTENTRPSL